MKIYIDVGHGGADPGAVGMYPGYNILERDLNLVMAQKLQYCLAEYWDVQTLLSRQSNDLSVQFDADGINGSAYRCNLWGGPDYGGPVDLMISVHNNASGSSGAKGYDVIHSVNQPPDLAQTIASELDAIGRPRHSIFTRPGTYGADYYGIIRETVSARTQAIILESVFIDNPDEIKGWIWDEGKGEYRMDKISQMMEATARGIAKYFKLQKTPVPVPKPVPVWKGIQKISITQDRIEGSMAVLEVSINGKIHIVNQPIEE